MNDLFLGTEALGLTALMALHHRAVGDNNRVNFKEGKLNSGCNSLATVNYCDGKL